MLMYFCDFLRNFLNNIPWKISLGLLYCEQICRFVIYTLVCHFFLKAAASLVGKGRVKQWRNYVNVFTAVAFGFWTLLGAYYLYRHFTNTGSNVSPCHRPEFMIQESLLMIVMIAFILAGLVIQNVVKLEIEE